MRSHVLAVKRVMRYLQATKDLWLTYREGESSGVTLTGFVDSNWGSDVDTRRSTTGWCFLLGGGVISWSSKLQATVALSLTEAEYIACCQATKEVLWLRRLMEELQEAQQEPTLLLCDSQGALALQRNPVFHNRTKHIDIQYHFVREKICEGNVKFEYVPTQEQVADFLTKALPRDSFEKLRGAAGLKNH